MSLEQRLMSDPTILDLCLDLERMRQKRELQEIERDPAAHRDTKLNERRWIALPLLRGQNWQNDARALCLGNYAQRCWLLPDLAGEHQQQGRQARICARPQATEGRQGLCAQELQSLQGATVNTPESCSDDTINALIDRGTLPLRTGPEPDIARDAGPLNLREALAVLDYHRVRAAQRGDYACVCDLQSVADLLESLAAAEHAYSIAQERADELEMKLGAARKQVDELTETAQGFLTALVKAQNP